ncbi:uncharacterized protein LOC122715229 [Apis laboriosa]|uniref:Uncharacterized protein LOC102654470 n=1 Tax=Apis mellifera TaxID=7460 RepID=A0A7M7L7B0_APIME|nr:uncharacterized protein LOC102679021 [Apis dorsata]XP_012345859.1 uncharacterized protein LOC105736325 [Apis florea]XP_026296502.1 uncharacterized protein LOC102654470 [Apis mellifera]XP_028520821.1 uncharacterized protein LOC107994445 [Apis cerana]XP_043793185.1 uncharacterized protein LOC122715229 [Apis laboriosa]KAG6800983.1 hypothetical protein HZU73_03721 [Apis mellifera caucasica]KAG9433809.1 hypothetical protein HZU67_04360 [Apis mellifera carnica]|eukprot:XP_026296502.1 uncharacterized protein LOC102654470 [Apis mellifera]
MDELAITREPIRKRTRIGNKCDSQTVVPISFPIPRIVSLPVEIIFEIFSYLSYKDLYAISHVSLFFNRLAYDPFLWRTYEVTNNEQDTAEVIKELKRMPLLKKFSISVRADCDEILRQISLTNKKLEELHVSNCTGSTSKLYLRSGYLIRILERCRNLHTINILGSRFRGRKFYRLLGDIGPRLRSVYAPATKSQFCTFIKYARQISETDRETICSMYIGVKSWAPLYYFVTKRADRVCTALISYLHNDILLIDANRSIHKLSITDRRNT